MTVQEVLHRLDTLHPNAYSPGEKCRWLAACEADVYHQVFATHQNPPPAPQGEELPLTAGLLVPHPYHWLYHHYLEGQMLYAAGEIAGYNNAMNLYSGILSSFWRYYHAHHRPLGHQKSVVS